MSKFSGCRACVLGLGKSGLAAAKLLQGQGAIVTAFDDTLSDLPEDINVVDKVDVSALDMLVVSPGVPREHSLYREAVTLGKKVLGETALACHFLEGRQAVGITGTNGKTTVTLLVTHILNHCGKKACAVGNVGTPMSSKVPFGTEVQVVELSSYQLETMDMPVFDAGMILNITPDHLDRYSSMAAYAEAKLKLGGCIKSEGVLFTGNHIEKLWRQNVRGKKVHSFGGDGSFDTFTDGTTVFYEGTQLPLPNEIGDVDNLVAAFVLCRHLGLEAEKILEAAGTFEKPPHRLEHFLTVDGISFFDDSKATNIDAVVRAVETMKGPVVLIAGGVHKGSSYQPWIEAFMGKVVHIVAIGESAEMIKAELGAAFTVEVADTMQEAVRSSYTIAPKGSSILLSPGCASFDMFRNFSHRGEEFQKEVKLVACSAC